MVLHQGEALRLRRAQVFSSTFYEVELRLALLYVEEATAVGIESLDSQNPSVADLCSVVFSQASGSQVALVAQTVGSQYDTRLGTNFGMFPDYRCSVVDSSRSYDGEAQDLLGPGFFTLQVHLKQGVFVTATTPPPLATVTSTVEMGFDRSSDGHVDFVANLREKNGYNSLLTVDLLDELSPFQTAPSRGPTRFPSARPVTEPPSSEPTKGPVTSRPSLRPSFAPTTLPTTSQPTPSPLSPTGVPSSLTPTQMPSALLTGQPTPAIGTIPNPPSTFGPTNTIPLAEQGSRISRTDRLMWGIGFGLLAITIFVSLCIVWRYCRRRRRRAKGPLAYDDAVAMPMSSAPIHVVRLDDAESLADTTLGDQTAGGFRAPPTQMGSLPKSAHIAEFSRRRKSMIPFKRTDTTAIPALLPPSIRSTDSFEDNSLYTSARPVSNVNHDALRITSTVMTMSAKSVALAVVPPSLSQSLDFDDDINLFPQGSQQSELGLEVVPVQKKQPARRDSKESDFDDLDQSFFFNDYKEDSDVFAVADEETKPKKSKDEPVSSAVASDTKGFDPFDDDDDDESSASPVDLEPRNAKREPIESVDLSDEMEQRLDDSQGKAEVENIISGCMPIPETQSIGSVSHEIGLHSIQEDVATYTSASRSPSNRTRTTVQFNERSETIVSPQPDAKDKPDNVSATSSSIINNSLLRSVLEGASRLAEAASSNRSRASRKTAPPRLDKSRKKSNSRADWDALAASEKHDFDESRSLETPKETKKFTMLSPPPGLRINLPPTPATRTTESTRSTPDSIIESDSEILDSPAGTLGAEPRSASWEDIMAGSGSEPNTPVSTPGVLGIARKSIPRILSQDSDESEPWLMGKVEDALGTASPRSNSNFRQTISDRSAGSTIADKSDHTIHHRGRNFPRSPSSVPSSRHDRPRSRSRSRRSNSRISEEKAADDEQLLPRALEDDLRKLELKLGDVRTTGGKSVKSQNSQSTRSLRRGKHVKKDRVIVTVPPGKLGVVLANRNDGKGTIVSEVRRTSAMHGALRPGDRLIEIDGEDVSSLVVKDIISTMASRSHTTRRLTVLTSWGNASDGETKTPY